jgi:hypothetical protein
MMSRVIPELSAMSTRTAISGTSMDEHCAGPIPKASQLRSVWLFSKGGAKGGTFRTRLPYFGTD